MLDITTFTLPLNSHSYEYLEDNLKYLWKWFLFFSFFAFTVIYICIKYINILYILNMIIFILKSFRSHK